mgnify:CR=1 FL=1
MDDLAVPAPPVQPVEDEKIDKKKPWTQEEDAALERLHAAHGAVWGRISKLLPGYRPDHRRTAQHTMRRFGYRFGQTAAARWRRPPRRGARRARVRAGPDAN